MLAAVLVLVLLLSAYAAPTQSPSHPVTQSPNHPTRTSPSAICNLQQAAYYYNRYHTLAPDDLLGLKRLAEVCTALEEGGERRELPCGSGTRAEGTERPRDRKIRRGDKGTGA